MKHRILKYITAVASIVLLAFAIVYATRRITYPNCHRYARSISLNDRQFRKIYGKPDKELEWTMALCVNGAEGNWDRISELTAEDRTSELGTYFHNLANAMKGCLADSLMYYYQPFERGLFIPVREGAKPFMVAQAGEVWFRLGSMTMAEHCTMLALTFSPKKNGRKFISRLADINFINGDKAATAKYAGLLGRYPVWTPEKVQIRTFIPITDVIHSGNDERSALRNLVEANRANVAAYEYLLCYDLLVKDIASFLRDYDASMPASRLYEEAALIHLAGANEFSVENIRKFRISEKTYREFEDFTNLFENGESGLKTLQEKYRNTYWFYFKFATRGN